MNFGFGADFRRALQGELYSARSGQALWLTVGFVVVSALLLAIVQSVVGLLLWPLVSSSVAVPASASDTAALEAMQAGITKAAIVGMLPTSLLVAWIVWLFAGINNRSGDRGMPFAIPQLGVAGWAVTVGGLIAGLWLVFALTFWVLGIDPATYAPGKDGVNDVTSSAGMVEKVMADLADEPLLFAMALPGVTIAVPIVEEMIFRGALFSALRHSWFGKTGAVVITAAAWAIIHAMGAPWLFVFIIFIMGLALGWLLLRFGSLTLTIICHACWNMVSSLAIFSGQVPS